MRNDVRQVVDQYCWVRDDDSPLLVAGCLTVVTGLARDAVGTAFGIDLATEVRPGLGDHPGPAAVQALGADPASHVVVLEDNDFQGSREIVLTAASKLGKAASIFWNVNELVVFSCARRGRVLFSADLEEVAERDDVPRSLAPYARLAEEDEVDLVALGAAMVAAFTGATLDSTVIATTEWHPIVPHVDELPTLTPDDSDLAEYHPDVLATLLRVRPDDRRELVGLIARATARRASLLEDDAVGEVLSSLSSGGVGTRTAALEERQRHWGVALDIVWRRDNDEENNGGDPLLSEERSLLVQPWWAGNALHYACHSDDMTALLGATEAMLVAFEVEDLGATCTRLFTSLDPASVRSWPARFEALPPARTWAEREAGVVEQRLAREAELVRQREQRHVDRDWGGVAPSLRIAAAGFWAMSLGRTDRALLDALAELTDDRLDEVTAWVVHQVLERAELLDRPWLSSFLAGPASRPPAADLEPQERGPLLAARLGDLFRLLQADRDITWTAFEDELGNQVSVQHMALPIALARTNEDALAAASNALVTASHALGPDTAGFYALVRSTFGLLN